MNLPDDIEAELADLPGSLRQAAFQIIATVPTDEASTLELEHAKNSLALQLSRAKVNERRRAQRVAWRVVSVMLDLAKEAVL